MNNFFDTMNGRRMALVFVGLGVVSVAATTAAPFFGFTEINWLVYAKFFLAACQRVPLVLLLTAILSYPLCRVQGITSFKMIKDSTEPWVAITLSAALIASIALVSIILR